MTDLSFTLPETYNAINEATKKSGFSMASDVLTGSLLCTLAAAKPFGKFLELGTGTGLSTSWILKGMDERSTLISIDNDDAFLQIAKDFLGADERVSFVLSDGETWIEHNRQQKFDYIFADTWHGKYLLLDEVLAMLNKGGIYIIDDMLPQPNWPVGHDTKAISLLNILQKRDDLFITPQVWSTGIVIAVKK